MTTVHDVTEVEGFVVTTFTRGADPRRLYRIHPRTDPNAGVVLYGDQVDRLADALKRLAWARAPGGACCGVRAGPYWCTLARAHAGQLHEAHGLDGELLSQWEGAPGPDEA